MAKLTSHRNTRVVALAAATVVIGSVLPAGAANIANVFKTTAVDLSVGTNYTTTITPTTATTTDVVFSGSYGATTFNANGAGLNYGTLNDTDITQSLVISNTGGAPASITLNTAANNTPNTGAAAATDLLFVKAGANLTIQSGAGASNVLTLKTAVSGNIDNAGTLSLAGPVSFGAGTTATFTGAGATAIGGNIAATNAAVTLNNAGGSVTLSGTNSYTGLTTVTAGTLVLAGDQTAANGGLTVGSAGTVRLKSTTALSSAGITLGGTVTNATGSALALANNGAVSLGVVNLGLATDTGGNGNIDFGSGAVGYSGVFGLTLLGTGATFTLNGATAVTAATGNSTLSINGGGNTLVFAGSTLVAGGTAQAGNQGTTFAGTGNVKITGAVQDSNNVKTVLGYSGTGTLTLAGTSTYTGNSNFASGTVNLTGSLAGSTVVNLTGGAFNESSTGLLSNAATTLTVSAGTATLAGSNTYGGLTTVTGGTLALDFSQAAGHATATNIINSSSNTSGLTLGGGTLLIKGGGSSGDVNSQRFATTILNQVTASTIAVNQNSATTVNLSLGTAMSRNSGATVDLSLPTGGTISTSAVTNGTGTNKINTSGSAAYSTAGATTWLTNTGGVYGALASGAYQVDSFASTTGDTDIQANDSPSALFTVNTLRFNTASKTLTLAGSGPSIVTTGGILITGAGSGSVIAGSTGLTSGTTAKELVIHDYSDLTVSAAVVNNGATAVALTNSGTGTTTLSGTNTATGAIRVANGTLQFAKEVSLYNNTQASWVGANINVGKTGTLAFNVGGTGEFSTTDMATLLDSTHLGVGSFSAGLLAGATVGFDTTNAAGGNFTPTAVLANTAGAAANAISYAKLGTNTLTLGNTNTYTGVTTVKGGTLALSTSTLNNNIASSSKIIVGDSLADSGAKLDVAGVTFAGGFKLANGQTLAGQGTVVSGAAKGAVTLVNGSILAPGNGVGVLSTGDLTLGGATSSTNGSTFLASLTGSGIANPSTTNYSQVNVTGGVNIGGGTAASDSILAFDLSSFSNPVNGALYFLIANDGSDAVTGRFKYGGIDLAQGTTFSVGANQFSISYTGNAEAGTPSFTGGNDVVLSSVVVPEPASLAMLGLGALGLLSRRRRS